MERVERNEKLNVRLSKQEKQRVEQMALEEGFDNTSDLIRAYIVGQATSTLEGSKSDSKAIYNIDIDNIYTCLKHSLSFIRVHIGELEETLELFEEETLERIELEQMIQENREVERCNMELLSKLTIEDVKLKEVS